MLPLPECNCAIPLARKTANSIVRLSPPALPPPSLPQIPGFICRLCTALLPRLWPWAKVEMGSGPQALHPSGSGLQLQPPLLCLNSRFLAQFGQCLETLRPAPTLWLWRLRCPGVSITPSVSFFPPHSFSGQVLPSSASSFCS